MFSGDFCDRVEPIDVMEEDADIVSSGTVSLKLPNKVLGNTLSISWIHDCKYSAHLTSIDCLFEA
jgi:hypothetical protein